MHLNEDGLIFTCTTIFFMNMQKGKERASIGPLIGLRNLVLSVHTHKLRRGGLLLFLLLICRVNSYDDKCETPIVRNALDVT